VTRPAAVKIVEVGPRDGLQNERAAVPLEARVEFIRALAAAGLRTIEAGSFVSPRRVPQMADTAAVLKALRLGPEVSLPVLVPNARGLADAKAAGARTVAVFAAASETFSRKNIGRGIEESLADYRGVVRDALAAGLTVRGYVSCVLGCPYEGAVPLAKVVLVAGTLAEMGCYEVSLGDTIGVGTADQAREMAAAVIRDIGIGRTAIHFHDTYGQALANVLACLELGIATVDASAAGLGGCPYAPGATGNLATEDLLYMLDGLGVATGVDLDRVAAAGAAMCKVLGVQARSRAALALAAAAGAMDDACSIAV
jgi:isopropylmalate/homocitrate/citramalate synthase